MYAHLESMAGVCDTVKATHANLAAMCSCDKSVFRRRRSQRNPASRRRLCTVRSPVLRAALITRRTYVAVTTALPRILCTNLEISLSRVPSVSRGRPGRPLGAPSHADPPWASAFLMVSFTTLTDGKLPSLFCTVAAMSVMDMPARLPM